MKSPRARIVLWIAASLAVFVGIGEIVARATLDGAFYARQVEARVSSVSDLRFDEVTTSLIARSVRAEGVRALVGGDSLHVERARVAGIDVAALLRGEWRPRRVHVDAIAWRRGPDRLDLEQGTADFGNGSLRLRGIRYAPALPDAEYFRPGRSQTIEITAATLDIDGADVDAYYRGDAITIPALSVVGFSADVRNDKNFSGERTTKTMPNALVAKLRPPVHVENLNVQGRASYSERPVDVPVFGTVTFEDITLAGGPVRSDDPSHFTQLDVVSRVNGEVALSTSFRWKVANPELDLDVRGNAESIDPTTFNSMFVPVSGILITGGTFEKLGFEYVLGESLGRGWFDAVYDSLAIGAVEPHDSTDTRAIVNWFLERRVQSSHVAGRDSPRSGEILYEREPWNSFFAYVWFSLRSGIQSMVLS